MLFKTIFVGFDCNAKSLVLFLFIIPLFLKPFFLMGDVRLICFDPEIILSNPTNFFSFFVLLVSALLLKRYQLLLPAIALFFSVASLGSVVTLTDESPVFVITTTVVFVSLPLAQLPFVASIFSITVLQLLVILLDSVGGVATVVVSAVTEAAVPVVILLSVPFESDASSGREDRSFLDRISFCDTIPNGVFEADIADESPDCCGPSFFADCFFTFH